MSKQWQVVDHNGEIVFPAETIYKNPAVQGGLYTAREWAKKLARDTSDPEMPPLRAVKA